MTWNKLLALQPVRDLVADRWNDSGGREWTDDSIAKHLSLIFPDAKDATWEYFPIARYFFNQPLMFAVIGYQSQAAFDALEGEFIAGCEFLDDVAALDWALVLSRFSLVKVRSAGYGDYTNIVSSSDDVTMLSGQSEFGCNYGGAQPVVVA